VCPFFKLRCRTGRCPAPSLPFFPFWYEVLDFFFSPPFWPRAFDHPLPLAEAGRWFSLSLFFPSPAPILHAVGFPLFFPSSATNVSLTKEGPRYPPIPSTSTGSPSPFFCPSLNVIFFPFLSLVAFPPLCFRTARTSAMPILFLPLFSSDQELAVSLIL